MRPTVFILVAVLLAACSHTPSAPLPNPVGFPLYPGSETLLVRPWHHALTSDERAAFGVVDEKQTAFAGHEVVANTSASFGDEIAWLRTLDASPPSGYRIGVWGSGVDQARDQARQIGIDFSVFDRSAGEHDVLVMVVDPSLLERKAGLMLTAIEHFRSLPDFLKAPIDAQARAQTGFTVSEALDPMTPMGAAVEALARLRTAGGRGVILFDAEPVR